MSFWLSISPWSQAEQLVQRSRKWCGWTSEVRLSSGDRANNKKSPPLLILPANFGSPRPPTHMSDGTGSHSSGCHPAVLPEPLSQARAAAYRVLLLW